MSDEVVPAAARFGEDWVGGWSSGIGVPTLLGRGKVARQGLAAVACAHDLRAGHGGDRHERWFWLAQISFLELPGVNEQFDLRSAPRPAARSASPWRPSAQPDSWLSGTSAARPLTATTPAHALMRAARGATAAPNVLDARPRCRTTISGGSLCARRGEGTNRDRVNTGRRSFHWVRIPVSGW